MKFSVFSEFKVTFFFFFPATELQRFPTRGQKLELIINILALIFSDFLLVLDDY